MASADDDAPTLAALQIGGSEDPWRSLGLALDGNRARVGDVVLLFGQAGAGITGWALRNGPTDPIDGLPGAQVGQEPPPARHPLGALRIDHVVVATPDVDRTIAALEGAGIRLRREREAESMGRPIRQAFFRLGDAIAEVVGPAEGPAGEGPAGFWGMVFVVEDLEAAAALLGDRLGAAKDAVQPGRRIATVRSTAGLGVPLALITP